MSRYEGCGDIGPTDPSHNPADYPEDNGGTPEVKDDPTLVVSLSLSQWNDIVEWVEDGIQHADKCPFRVYPIRGSGVGRMGPCAPSDTPAT